MFFSPYPLRINRLLKKFLLFAAVLGTTSYAYDFNCKDSIYGAKKGDAQQTTIVRYYDLHKSGAAYSLTNVTFKGNGVHDGKSTIALGYAPDGNGGVKDELRIYRWQYDTWNVTENTSLARPSYILSGDDTNKRHFVYYDPSGLPAGVESAGGEINPMTGEIYMTSKWDSDLGWSFWMMVINPLTGATRSFRPKRGSSQPNLFQAVSDMTIDAEGNVFIIANDYTYRDKYYLTRIDMATEQYSVVKQLSGALVTEKRINAGALALLNGYVYVHDSVAKKFYEVDLSTGNSKVIAEVTPQFLADDFASCQIAIVIRGKIYNDTDGDGVINGNEPGIDGVTVELYDDTGKIINEQVTKDSGDFSFMVNSLKTYYIRVKNPKINGVAATQTWASGEVFEYTGKIGAGNNTVTNYCTDFNRDDTVGSTSNRTCYGKRKDGVDSLTSTLAAANHYSKVIMQTDKIVPYAEFAFSTAIDTSDAPKSFKEVSHSMIRSIYLGECVTPDIISLASESANIDTCDDGVKVRQKDNQSAPWEPLQEFTFVSKTDYTFNVTMKEVNTKGYLNAWISLQAKNAAATTFETKIADNIDVFAKKICEGGICYVLIDYQVPDISAGVGSDNKSKAYSRFRYSTVKVNNMNPYDAANSPLLYGEVEDYKFTYHYYNPPKILSGEAIVVNENFKGSSADYKFGSATKENANVSLYTQVAGQSFNVKLVYHEDGVVKTIQDANGTIDIVEVKDAELDYYTNNATCKGLKTIKEARKGNMDSVVKFSTSVDNAYKRATFRVTFGYNGSSENKTTCSPDLFAIRPAEFKASGFSSNTLVGGKEHNGTLEARAYGGTVTIAYNQPSSSLSYKNANLTIPASCDASLINATIDATTFWVKHNDFIKGNASMSVQYDNVGNVSFVIVDSNWTKVDQMTKRNDCIVNSSNNTHNS
ncbi:MAG: hypothetical protein LBQ18_08375, partial [Campylobacteraceae bacterium]|nr:hypothetical protein [Campylobacteraceae bacterium]